MGHFDYARMSQGLLTPKTVELLTAIYEYKGRQALYLNAKTDVFDALTEVAKVQSTVASNRIEGIRTGDRCPQQIMSENSDLRSRDEEIAAYRDAVASEAIDPLLISLIFVFDFTRIHPFNDSNGRMSRLLTLLLLYKAGYMTDKFVSIEKEIERTKNAYYNALAAISQG